MSTRYIPTKDNHRAKKLKWINCIVHVHDIHCDCTSPLEHTICEILQQEPEIKFNNQERDLLKKCLGTTTEEDHGDGIDAFGDGELEALFNEDTGEDATG